MGLTEGLRRQREGELIEVWRRHLCVFGAGFNSLLLRERDRGLAVWSRTKNWESNVALPWLKEVQPWLVLHDHQLRLAARIVGIHRL